MTFLTAALVIVVLFLTAYIAVFAIAGLLVDQCGDRIADDVPDNKLSRFLILVPAHNEGEHLRPTLRSLRVLDYPPDCFDVVTLADNCTDETAYVAAQEGSGVWERIDPTMRGKGHALAWALSRRDIRLYDAIVFMDADTVSSRNLLRVCNREINEGVLAIQVRLILQFPAGAPPWLSVISHATQRAEDTYVTRPRSGFRLYQGLQGTGFCLTAQSLAVAPWKATSLTEDLEYGFELAKHGIPVRFAQDAFVITSMTGRLRDAGDQRERWSRGTYRTIAKLLPAQLFRAIRTGDWKSFESCFYLLVRSRIPLFVLTLLAGLSLCVEWNHVQSGLWALYATALLLQCLYVLAILMTVRSEGGCGSLVLKLAVYLAWICRQHVSALLNLRRNNWKRTERG